MPNFDSYPPARHVLLAGIYIAAMALSVTSGVHAFCRLCSPSDALTVSGFNFITGYDWAGNDIANSAPAASSVLACLTYCNNAVGARLGVAMIAFNNMCWCKGYPLPTSTFKNTNSFTAAAGPGNRIGTTNVLTGATRTRWCPAGMVVVGVNLNTCQANGEWDGDSCCAPPGTTVCPSYFNCPTISSSAQAFSSSAELISSSAELVSSSAELVSSSAELISSSAELVSSSAELISSSAEPISSSAEAVSSSAELVSSSAQTISSSARPLLSSSAAAAVSSSAPVHVSSSALPRLSSSAGSAPGVSSTASASAGPVSSSAPARVAPGLRPGYIRMVLHFGAAMNSVSNSTAFELAVVFALVGTTSNVAASRFEVMWYESEGLSAGAGAGAGFQMWVDIAPPATGSSEPSGTVVADRVAATGLGSSVGGVSVNTAAAMTCMDTTGTISCTSTTDESGSSSNKLSGGAIAGIVIACVVASVLICYFCYTAGTATDSSKSKKAEPASNIQSAAVINSQTAAAPAPVPAAASVAIEMPAAPTRSVNIHVPVERGASVVVTSVYSNAV